MLSIKLACGPFLRQTNERTDRRLDGDGWWEGLDVCLNEFHCNISLSNERVYNIRIVYSSIIFYRFEIEENKGGHG